MAAKIGLSVEVQGDDIVVSLPGTSYVVTYYRATAFPRQLLTKSYSGREDQGAPMTQTEFRARAWLPTTRQKNLAGSCEEEARRCGDTAGLLVTPKQRVSALARCGGSPWG
jgi:hypothetical protein